MSTDKGTYRFGEHSLNVNYEVVEEVLGIKKGDKVKVGIYNTMKGGVTWHPAVVTGFTSPDVGEDYPRINVELLTDGRMILGCHQSLVRKEEVSNG